MLLTGPPTAVQADVYIVYIGGFQEVDMVCIVYSHESVTLFLKYSFSVVYTEICFHNR